MQNRAGRSAIALIAALTVACYGSQSISGVAPAEYVTRQRPPFLLVVTTRGETLELVRPVVVRDSLVQTEQHTRMEAVTIPRPPDSAVTSLPPDARGHRRILVPTATGEQLEISRPRFTADSILGMAQVTRGPGFGVALSDIRDIRLRRLDSTATTISVVLVLVGVGVIVTAYTLMTGGVGN